MVDVKTIDMGRYQITLFNLIAAHQDKGTLFTPKETAFVRGAFPEDRLPYMCYRNTGLTSVLEQNASYREYLIQHSDELLNLALELTLRAPKTTLSHFICNGAFVYRIFEYLGYYETAWLVIVPNRYAIIEASLVPSIKPWMTAIIKSSADQNGLNWLVWRSSFWMYLLFSGCIPLCFRKKTIRYWLVMVPCLLAIGPLIILSFGQIFRYVYSMYLCGILLSGYFWVSAASEDSDQ